MKKFWLICLVLLLLRGEMQAQSYRNRNKSENQWISVGVKGGVSMPRMLYWQNVALSQLSQETAFRPTGGLFVDIPLGSVFSVAPEVMYARRGTNMHYLHHSGAEVNYSMDVSFVDVRVPVEARWPIVSWLQPYVLIGAEAGARMGGSIHMDRTQPALMDTTIAVGSANMSLLHAGVFAGLGIRSKVELGSRDMLLKLAASYHQGLLDTYSPMERQGEATASNVNAYQTTGLRLPQGLELTLSIGISLGARQDDACATFARDRYRHRGSR